MVYGDVPSMNYWKLFVKNEPHERAEINHDERLIEQYLQYLTPHPASLSPKERKEQAQAITCFGFRDWGKEPFEAGCHIWKSGILVGQSIAALASFGVADSISQRKFISAAKLILISRDSLKEDFAQP